MASLIGIDFGTTNSVVAVLGADGEVRTQRFATPAGPVDVFLLVLSPGSTGSFLLSPSFEFELLKFLVNHRGETVTREQLLDAVWGYDAMMFTRTVVNHIAKLRQKIEADPENPAFILTVHRVGYRFVG